MDSRKSQQVNRQEVDFQKKTEDAFPSRFHKNKACCGLLAVDESRCKDQCENHVESSFDTQIAENSSKNVSKELKSQDHISPKDKQISDELRKTDENINKFQNIKKSQSVENLKKNSEINLTNKCLYTNLNASPKEKNALDERAMFIKFHSLELCADKLCSLHIHEKCSTDIHKCVVDSESNKPNKVEKCLDYESVKRYPCKVSNEPLEHNTASKPQILYETRPIYPNVPYSPYSTPFSSPRSSRRKPAFRESRRISIDKSGSFLQLNQYRLMEQIGQGSYGLVKLAYSEEDSTHYAMKILSKKRLLRQAGLMRRGPRKATSPLDRVYREIAVLKKLDHPNVVKLVEVLDDPLEDSLYMVFELVKQGEVLRIPTDNPLSEKRAWSIFRESLLGLEYLHHQKIIHADIKPGNILLTEFGQVKIADLGVCNEFLGDDATISNGSTAGTPAFRAPETLIPGQNEYCGRAADVWALGATLYSLIFGNVPFLADSVPLLYEKIKHDSVKFPENHKVTENLKSCIVQMLEKDAKHRITIPQLKTSKWVTSDGEYPLPTEEENCCLVQVDDEDIDSVVRSIPKLDTLILIKTMLKKHSFGNPFVKGSSGTSSSLAGCSRIERFIRAGRSNSAPGSYHMPTARQPSSDTLLPSLMEHCSTQCNEETHSFDY
ncbi:calcium/calmodulin-dependent protein kinase kinase 1 isoform X1 [Drosophila sechellia]|uniref:calcium/calmodulin-dependent protein kinase kinase 1 isoform X1 n=1 Tax=Drosophila sechellia TaxID=7238 RepID=UPI0013DE2A4C|nr:calcium/calmodulin-dependent protein kinase kinase 1 isoform X1 [Drosophila sechellia]